MQSIPEDFRQIYELLEQEISWLHLKWQIYQQVFLTTEERIELLNEFAPATFRVFQDSLLDDLILSLSRLIDPLHTGARGNYKESLSLIRLVNSIDPIQYSELRPKAQKLWGQVENYCKPFRDLRHQRIAHTNLAAVKATTELYPGISAQMIEEALAKVRNLMNEVSIRFEQSTNMYEVVPPEGKDGERLIYNLERLHKFYEKYGDEVE